MSERDNVSKRGRIFGMARAAAAVATICATLVASAAALAVAQSGAQSAAQPRAQSAASPPPAGIYVVGALHGLHEQVPGFDYAALGRVIEAIRPEVMLLETRPDELSGRTDTPGRPEYPRVVWPYLARQNGVTALPLEPGGELFEKWVGEASNDHDAFEKNDPQGASYWSSYQRSLSTLLKAHWQTAAHAHDILTADMARSWYLVQYSVGGKPLEDGQERWDAYMIDRAREAVRAHPDKRILVLASYRNRHRFDLAMREAGAARVVDMQAWLAAQRL